MQKINCMNSNHVKINAGQYKDEKQRCWRLTSNSFSKDLRQLTGTRKPTAFWGLEH